MLEDDFPKRTKEMLAAAAERAKGLHVVDLASPRSDAAMEATVYRGAASEGNYLVVLDMDPAKQGCTCGYWKEYGAPCEHAHAVFEHW